MRSVTWVVPPEAIPVIDVMARNSSLSGLLGSGILNDETKRTSEVPSP